MMDFHFLYPHWLWLLAVIPALVWWLWRYEQQSDWQQIIDPALAPFVLSGETGKARKTVVLTAVLMWLLGVVALAAPSWEKRDVPVYQKPHALVIALDLSTSMYAKDTPPSRLAQARFKLQDILQQHKDGQTGLVVFAGDAFAVTPLTTDIETIVEQATKLSPDVMPAQGSRLSTAIIHAQQLLEQAQITQGDILLITDGVSDTQQAVATAEAAKAKGYTVSVLAVGSKAGAPIPLPEAGFLTDSQGKTVMAVMNFDELVQVANAGGGVSTRLSVSGQDLAALQALWDQHTPKQLLADQQAREIGMWVNQGYWFVLLLLPLALLVFRRGWILVLPLVLLPQPETVLADMWKTPDQAAYEILETNPKQAQSLFEDQRWKAAAAYKAQDYEAATRLYAEDQSLAGQYNYANALAQSKQLEKAAQMYEKVLAQQPDHADAKHNYGAVKQALAKQKQQKKQSKQKKNEGQQPKPKEGEQPEQGNPQQGQPSPNEEQEQGGQQGQDQPPNEQETKGKQEQQPQAKPDQEKEGEDKSQAKALSPEELKQREQDQAAEQWLRRIPDDPAGLWRRKFQYQYQQRDAQAGGEQAW